MLERVATWLLKINAMLSDLFLNSEKCRVSYICLRVEIVVLVYVTATSDDMTS